jgi:hypothetical protein
LKTDEEVSSEVVKNLRRVEGINWVNYYSF